MHWCLICILRTCVSLPVSHTISHLRVCCHWFPLLAVSAVCLNPQSLFSVAFSRVVVFATLCVQPWLEFLAWLVSAKAHTLSSRLRLLMTEYQQISCRGSSEFIQGTRISQHALQNPERFGDRQLEAFVSLRKLTCQLDVRYWA